MRLQRVVVGLVVLVVAGVGDPWLVRASIRTIAVSPGPFGLVVNSATGRAFLSGTQGLEVLDIATGASLHRTTLPLAPNGGWPPTVIPDERSGRVFAIVHPLFGPGADQVAVLNAASGHQVGTLRFPVGTHAAQVVVDEHRGRAYLLLTPSTGRTLTVLVLDATSGRLVRTLSLLTAGPTASLSAPLGRYALDMDPRSGELYVTEGTAGIVHGFAGTTGRPLWSVSLHPLADIPDYSPTIRPPLVDAQTERLFVFNYRMGLVSVLDARTGHRVRTVPMPPGGIDLVACRRTQRVFVFHGGKVSVLDAASGRLLRTVAIGPPRGLGPAVVDEHDGRLFLVNWLTGAILVLNAHTGRVVRTIVVGGVPTNLVVSQRLGRVFVSTTGPSGLRVTTGRDGNGSVHVLDGRSGTIVRTWPVGRFPGPMAVDERHRYLVVLNLNGSDLGPGPWAWIPTWLRRWLPFLADVPATQTLASCVTVIDLSHV